MFDPKIIEGTTVMQLLFLGSEELDRRTKETQRLQDEVENATRAALERFRCTTGINSSSEQSYHDGWRIVGRHMQAVSCNIVV